MKLKTITRSAASVAIGVLLAGTAIADDADNQQPNRQPPNSSDTTDRSQDKQGQNQHGQFSASDSEFARKAACGGAAEVALGRLAVEKGSSDAVKQFGQRMVDDHGKANQQLQDIASRKGVSLPAEPTPEEKKGIEKLRGLSGQEFDNEYVNMMTEDHKKDLKAFKQASQSADDADLKSFAASTEPVVKEHLKMLETMPTSSKRTPTD